MSLQTDLLTNILAGGVAGCAVDLTLFPLDTAKTLLQVKSSGKQLNVPFSKFYRGLTSAMLGSFPSCAVFFSLYEPTKAYFLNKFDPKYSSFAYIIASSTADAASTSVRVPFEVIKQQMQAGMHKNTWQAMKNIHRISGTSGFYAGYYTTLFREIPFGVIEFLIYEHGKVEYKRRYNQDVTPLAISSLGAISGAIAAFLTTPLDVVKTRLMTQVQSGSNSNEIMYKGTFDCLKRMHAEEGWKSLFAGVKPRVTWISIAGAMFFTAYEHAKAFLIKNKKPSNDLDDEMISKISKF